VFAFTNVVNLFANELAGLGRRCLPFAFVPTGSLDRFLFWHLLLLLDGDTVSLVKRRTIRTVDVRFRGRTTRDAARARARPCATLGCRGTLGCGVV
jgi:hypothetical protein